MTTIKADLQARLDRECLQDFRNYESTRARAVAIERIARDAIAALPDEPVAWEFRCEKVGGGSVSWFLDFQEDSTIHWPLDQWRKVTKRPLYTIPAKDGP